jgi:hypothetical protein
MMSVDGLKSNGGASFLISLLCPMRRMEKETG